MNDKEEQDQQPSFPYTYPHYASKVEKFMQLVKKLIKLPVYVWKQYLKYIGVFIWLVAFTLLFLTRNIYTAYNLPNPGLFI